MICIDNESVNIARPSTSHQQCPCPCLAFPCLPGALTTLHDNINQYKEPEILI